MYNSKLYNTPYHKVDISKSSFLITGGAGFIGSNLVEYLLKFNAGHVRVLDNLSNGYIENIKPFFNLSNFEFIEGDIRDLETCRSAVNNIDFISHQAALGSVPRSIQNPITTNEVNISGFLNLLTSAKDSTTLKKMVYAASSSTYGDSTNLPKVEGFEGKPLSPYAVTKIVNELYAHVFSKIYNFHTVGLRYFNIFGPKQNPNNPYAAVIPIFCKNYLEGSNPIIYGDGFTSRDFTFIENAIQGNIKAMLSGLESNVLNEHIVFNLACGDQITLNDIIEKLNIITNTPKSVSYRSYRVGDVKHSKADISKISNYLNYEPLFRFDKGLEIVFEWYAKNP